MVAAVWFLYFRAGGFQWGLFWETFRKLDWRWLAVSVFFALLTYLGRALRWQVLLRPMREKSSLWNLFSATAVGFSAIVLLGRPGEMVRPYLIAMKERVSFSSQVGAWLLERVYDLLMALVIFGLALSRVDASQAALGEGLQWVLRVGGFAVGILGAVCLGFLFAVRKFSDTFAKRLLAALSFLPESYKHRIERYASAFSKGMGSTRSNSFVATVLMYTVIEWVLIVFCYLAVFQASPVTRAFHINDVLIFVGFVSFGAVIQIPGVGGGLQLTSIVVLTELFGLGIEVSSGIAMVIWSITFVVIVPFGLVLALHDGLNWRKLKELSREASL